LAKNNERARTGMRGQLRTLRQRSLYDRFRETRANDLMTEMKARSGRNGSGHLSSAMLSGPEWRLREADYGKPSLLSATGLRPESPTKPTFDGRNRLPESRPSFMSPALPTKLGFQAAAEAQASAMS
jgi:hypothetical protein